MLSFEVYILGNLLVIVDITEKGVILGISDSGSGEELDFKGWFFKFNGIYMAAYEYYEKMYARNIEETLEEYYRVVREHKNARGRDRLDEE